MATSASTPTANSGISDLLQTISANSSSAVGSALSSTAVQAALQKASPGDLVKLSQQALQLQEAAGLLGDATGAASSPDAPSDPGTALLQALSGQAGAASAATSTTAETPAQQEASSLASSLSTTSQLG